MRTGKRSVVLVGALALAIIGAGYIVVACTGTGIMLNDVSTDLDEPPMLPGMPIQEEGVTPAYSRAQGNLKPDAQRLAYPDLMAGLFAEPPRRVFEEALEVARTMNWSVNHQDPAGRWFHAVAVTRWLRFEDDVVVRVLPHRTGSRVDLRSASRVGKSDLGANARRIRQFLKHLEGRGLHAMN